MTNQVTKKLTGWMLGAALMAGSAGPLLTSAAAQDRHDNRNRNDQFRNGYQQQRPYNDQYDRQRYGNNGDYRQHQGGIGPGKGALIGGAGGAALGAIFGGGLKGALIGGGIGAGGGALIGKAAQNKRDNRDDRYNNNRDYRDRYDRNGQRY